MNQVNLEWVIESFIQEIHSKTLIRPVMNSDGNNGVINKRRY